MEKSDASLENIASLPPGATLPAGKWQPGVNYEPLVPAQPTSAPSGKVEVLELFWLASAPSYALEPRIRAWLKSKAAYIDFVRVPVYWQSEQRAHARLFYTLDSLGRADLVEKAFETLHSSTPQHPPPLVGASDDETFRMQQQFAVANGLPADDFAKAYNSATVSADLAHADEITQRYRAKAVPLFAVNGKYTTDESHAGGADKLFELINDLASSEHRAH
jgi:protein dithiol oxidoreductase (disulfide-forming)